MSAIAHNLQTVRRALEHAAATAHRSAQSVTLLAVSKTFPAATVREAYQAGQTTFGENYVQEALLKMESLRDLPLEWHFIGPIQSNKTRAIAEHFSWAHSVEKFSVAERLSTQRGMTLPPLNVCIQVNVSNEASKSGVAPEETETLARAIAALPGVKLRGLMAIPAPAATLAAQRQPFARLHELLTQLNARGLELDTLSMGMSQDMEAAILEGATMVRVGTGIFGSRLPPP
ncbi:MAG: YggS family pyridoxal phosphate-dependent enzyme [Gallionellaceae bacterium]|jgi:pyridoxal phosphate enzyme (YggS family)|nr:YggS family pyridoxal phosphate-dependent enzyme [Gallionellaceae bacterium]